MTNNIIATLKNKKIAILGFGTEGKSTYKYLRKHLKEQTLTILDSNIKLLEKNKDLLLDNNLRFVLGESYLNNLDSYDFIIKAPGIYLNDNIKRELAGKITSQIGLILDYTNIFLIGITGTKGKSTTSTLIYEVIKKLRGNVFLTGNIGYPIFDYLDIINDETILISELSSYQTEFITKSPQISIILNLFEEHLDFHKTLDNYYDSKLNVFKYQKENDWAIYNYDNEELKSRIKNNRYLGQSIKLTFDENADKDDMILCNKKNIYLLSNGKKKKIYNLKSKRKLLGMHNIYPIMCTIGVAKILNLNLRKVKKIINSFKPLKHRLEKVAKYRGITFYDDAIATIPNATLNAITALKKVDTLILGGLDRGINYSGFAKSLINTKVRNFICMPDTGYKIANDLKTLNSNKNIYLVSKMEDVVKLAYKITKKGKICLLSPAAPSYNNYKNFEEKGDFYVEFIKKHK